MTAHMTSLAATGWEIAAAIGTIAGAVATAAAVIAALVIAGSDRRAADKSIGDQITANDAAVKQQIRAAELERSREHEVALLVALTSELGRLVGTPTAQRKPLRGVARAYSLALPHTSMMPAVRLFGIARSTQAGIDDLNRAYPELPEHRTETDLAHLAQNEIAERLQYLVTQ